MEKEVLIIAKQGMFSAGGTVLKTEGVFNSEDQFEETGAGQTSHADHANVFYQIPAEETGLPIVFLHGYGQSRMGWMTTPDGREGWSNLFLRKGHSVYLIDQPRRGEAGQTSVSGIISEKTLDQRWYVNFRMGRWENDKAVLNKNSQFPDDEYSIDQFFRQMTPDTGDFNQKVVADAMVKVFEKSGNGVLVTHSAGGGPGWDTAIASDKVKGVIALEPGTFPFPKGKLPEVEKTTSPFPAKGYEVSDAEFKKLTKIPIVVYFFFFSGSSAFIFSIPVFISDFISPVSIFFPLNTKK